MTDYHIESQRHKGTHYSKAIKTNPRKIAWQTMNGVCGGGNSIKTKSRTDFFRKNLTQLVNNILRFLVSTLEVGGLGILFFKLQFLGVVQINYLFILIKGFNFYIN